MSLSFVSSAVLSSSDGVSHNEEKSIESKEVQALRGKQQAAKPLFEQLRANQEEEEMKREEFQRTVMRGTRALDEEDCAHLDAIQKQKLERETEIKSQTEQELALFRAAKAERVQGELVGVDEDAEEEEEEEAGDAKTNETTIKSDTAISSTVKKPFVPVIVGKRKRRQQPEKEKDKAQSTPKRPKKSEEPKEEEEEGLGGLLGGYGSSDDSD